MITLENAGLQDRRCAHFLLDGKQKRTAIYVPSMLLREDNSKMPNGQKSVLQKLEVVQSATEYIYFRN